MKHYVIVLNDGETYTNLDGCKILVLDSDPNDPDDFGLDDRVKNHGIENILAEFTQHKHSGEIEMTTWEDSPLLFSEWSR